MKKRLLAIGIVMGILLLTLTGCVNMKTTKQGVRTKPTSIIENTSWVASDGSEIIFGDDEVNWYQTEGEYDDNYYFGEYEFYIGDDAVEFITTELSSYGIAEEDLESVFARSEEYNRENFVVFYLEYDGIKINGQTTTPSVSVLPWFGFILENNTYLDVANMNTGTYYAFTKK